MEPDSDETRETGFKPGWTRTPPKAEIEGRYWEIVDRLSGKNKLRHRCTYPTGPDEPKCNYTARGIMNMKSHVNTVHIKKLICKFLFVIRFYRFNNIIIEIFSIKNYSLNR